MTTVTAEDVERTGRITVLALRKEIAWVLRMGTLGVRALVTVALLALVFTMVNVQVFASAGHPVNSLQWLIGWLLDPMASVTMGTAIVFEGVLAGYRHGVGWLTATKWYAGVCTWGMNVWASVVAVSWSGMLLHSVAPGLVLLLAEAAPRVRRRLSEIVAELERREADIGRTRLAAERDAEQARRWQRDEDERRRAAGELITAQDVLDKATELRQAAVRAEAEAAASRAATEAEAAATKTVAERLARLQRKQAEAATPASAERPVASPKERLEWVQAQYAATGRYPTGAEVDTEFGPPRTGARIVAKAKAATAEQKPLYSVGGNH